MKIAIIGDVHGKFKAYERLITNLNCDMTIQVGDFGIGFGLDIDPETLVKNNSYFIRGNHDNLKICRNYSNFIEDGEIRKIGDKKIMFIGGAYSVDKDNRTIGIDWWDDEEITYGDASRISDIYINNKPDIVITHDCPSVIYSEIATYKGSSFTSQVFDFLFENHKPEAWYFGHHHRNIEKTILGTTFRCIHELSHVILEV